MKEEGINHRRIKTNGIWMHLAEKGDGPNLVVLLHGFPELWYSWRHHIHYLSDNGYHVVAPDLRGYGDSDSPLSPSSYSVFHLAADVLGILDYFGQQQPRNPDVKPTDFFTSMFGDGFYISQFQEAGRAEKAFARYDYLTVMKKFLLITKTDVLVAPPGMEIIDNLQTPAQLPHWITEQELQFYADKFQETGFTAPLNYYRAMDLNWELCGAWQGSKITVPTKFIVGDKEIGFEAYGSKDYVKGDTFKNIVPNLEVAILDGHHFIQQENPQQVSQEILAFLRKQDRC